MTTRGKHKDRIDLVRVLIQGDVTVRFASNDQLTLTVCDGPADQWIVRQHVNSMHDLRDPGRSIFQRILELKNKDSIEVLDKSRRRSAAIAMRAFNSCGKRIVVVDVRASRIF